MSVKGLLRSIFFFLIFIVIALFTALTFMTNRDRANKYTSELKGLQVPQFDEQSINFEPTYDGTLTLPFTASAIVDIDGDGIEELFIGGGIDQQDALFQFRNGAFVE